MFAVLFPLLAARALGGGVDCCNYALATVGGWPPAGKAQEEAQFEDWYDAHSGDWKEWFERPFVLWDEFDQRRSPENLEKLKAMDPEDDLDCETTVEALRWGLGYEIATPNRSLVVPDIYDWDDKIAKKSIVASMQPDSDPELWYTPSIYEGYSSLYVSAGEQAKLRQALLDYFEKDPDGFVILKSAVAGGSGASLLDCTETETTKNGIFKITRDNVDAVPLCSRLILEHSRQTSASANPALKYAHGGILAEPGFVHTAEFKTVVIWGRVFSAGMETPGCAGVYTRDYDIIRGGPDDERWCGATTTYREVLKTSDISRKQWDRLVAIAEGMAAHTDFLRVDLFFNPKTNQVRVNEVEGYFKCFHTACQQNFKATRLMAKTWVRGWQAFLADARESSADGADLAREPLLSTALRPYGREQMAIYTAADGGGTRYVTWWAGTINLCFIAALACLTGFGLAAFCCRSSSRRSARAMGPADRDDGVELTRRASGEGRVLCQTYVEQ